MTFPSAEPPPGPREGRSHVSWRLILLVAAILALVFVAFFFPVLINPG